MKKDITIYDIAEKLQLAPSTISRALNNHPAVNKKTQKKVLTTAKEMGYRFNTFASNLRKQQTRTIGVIVPRLNSYFMSDVIAGIEMVTNKAGFNLIISQSLENVEKEMRSVQTMFNSRVDGLLVSLAENTTNIGHFDVFFERGLPLFFFDRVPLGDTVPTITINNEEAGYQATRHLIDHGARKVCHISGNQLTNVYSDRFKGYLRALHENSLPFDEEMLYIGDLSEAAGIAAAKKIMEIGADAIFSANDNCAVSCMNALKKLGLKIPHDILVAGFNNDMMARSCDPALTTVNYPGFTMGEIAAQNIINHLEGRQDIQMMTRIILRSELIVRESTAR